MSGVHDLPHRAFAAFRRLRAAGRGSARRDRRRRRSRALRRDGQPLRSQPHDRAARVRGDQAARERADRRASDGEAGRPHRADFAQAGASIISFHPEASEHVDRTIGLIHEQGCKAGLVFNPATPLDWLMHVIDKLDLVLIMSVNPGFGGQSFIPHALDKLRAARKLVDMAKERTGRDILLEVDGGVKVDNIGAIAPRAPTRSSPAARSSASPTTRRPSRRCAARSRRRWYSVFP